MPKVVLPVFYMPPISWYAEFLNDRREVILENYENFPKQTYRNRSEIFGANGRQALIIPVKHNEVKTYKDIEMSFTENWKAQHWKSIKSAYQNSPYFPYYEDKIKSVFEEKEPRLFEFNLKILSVFNSILKINREFSFTEEYEKTPLELDLRASFSAKKPSGYSLPPYYQVFSERFDFLNDLSILDLVCNKGPESLTYIKNIKIK